MTSLEEEAVELDRAAVRLATIASRAASRVDSAVSELTHGIVSVIKALESARRRFKSESARVASHRSLWLDKQLEECDAVEKSFDSFVRLIDSGALAPDDTLHALASLRQLIDNTAFPRLPVMVAVDPGAIISIKTIISQASRFQSGPSPAHCVLEGIGLEYCCPGLSNHARTRNQLSLTCKDEVNEGIRSLLASDFAVSVEGGAGVTLVSANVVVDVFPNSSLGIVYTVTLPEGKLPDEPTVEICVSLLGCELAKRNIRIGKGIVGNETRSLRDGAEYRGGGLARVGCAISHGNMFISSLEAKAILAFSLPSMRFMLKLGEPGSGPGQFNRPNKLCVAPNGNLITADDENYRLVEMSQDGVFVRTFGGAPIDGYIISVAMSSDGLVAAGKGRDQGGDQVYIFDYRTGCVVRSFGRRGTGPGELHSCAGMRFTPNGRHLVIAERRNSRLSVFTPVGEFVRLIGVGFLDNPRDLDFADNGDLLVLETERGKVSVFSPLESGAVFLRRFGSLASPTACTVHNGELYVIEDSSRTVRVFN